MKDYVEIEKLIGADGVNCVLSEYERRESEFKKEIEAIPKYEDRIGDLAAVFDGSKIFRVGWYIGVTFKYGAEGKYSGREYVVVDDRKDLGINKSSRFGAEDIVFIENIEQLKHILISCDE